MKDFHWRGLTYSTEVLKPCFKFFLAECVAEVALYRFDGMVPIGGIDLASRAISLQPTPIGSRWHFDVFGLPCRQSALNLDIGQATRVKPVLPASTTRLHTPDPLLAPNQLT